MNLKQGWLAAAVLVGLVSSVCAQVPAASEHHKILKMEEGKWTATTKLYMGPTGVLETPAESTGTEENKMLGEFWLISNFDGFFGGMPFKGHGTFGYNAAKKRYVGTWVDSFNPASTQMYGTYDEATKTMTYETIGVGMDGGPAKGKNVVVYKDKDTRIMTMYMTMPGQKEMAKVMEIQYKRAK